MPKVKLTEQRIRDTHVPAGQSKVALFDTQTPGLMLELRATGSGTYYLRYTTNQGRIRLFKLGRLGGLNLADARRAVRHQHARIARGEDPGQERADNRNAPTLERFAQERYLPHAKNDKRSWKTDEILLRRHILPRLGNYAMSEIRRTNVYELVHTLRQHYRPATVNRVLILLRYMYNLALEWEIPGVNANPTGRIPMLRENNRHERYLRPEETHRLFAELDRSANPLLRYIVPMLALTGARCGEVLRARWEDLDFDLRLWRIPLPKSGEARHVPLSDHLMRLLRDLDTYEHSPWVFPNPRTGKPFFGIYKAWHSARKRAGLPDLRIHDLRHSYASLLINNGYSLYEVQKLLGHTQITTTQRYAHLSQERLLAASNDVGRVLEPMSNAVADQGPRR
ncbi:site-specific integrase [Halorhodospira sp. 9622]|uniref:site-specific integrase n=1 Tax=Halorhodospira sp. 9622 TaxID=2899136 RepID=UPI001EE8AE36|nr:site-specific integrase [Halorhodospira sp. 9622]MCG5539503.1 tyrosine-type recombinase/integrase [Halorhodospira sp. 9622]